MNRNGDMNNQMRPVKTFIMAVMLSIFFMHCFSCSVQHTAADAQTGRYNFTGTVVYLDLEGGFYGITGDDGNNYDPVNLPVDMQADGLRVQVVADPSPATAGIHMWGKLIKIIEIRPLAIRDND